MARDSGSDAAAEPAFGTLVFRGLKMVDATVGWTVDNRDRVLRTEDAGERFVPTEQPTSADPTVPLRLAAVDRSTAWVVDRKSSSFFRTSDGGATWTRGAVPADGTGAALALLDDRHAWLSVEDVHGKDLSTQALFSTEDGGKRWKKQGTLRVLFLVPIVPRTAQAAWTAGPVNGDESVLYRTLDAGRTWKKISLTVPAAFAGAPNVRMRPRSSPAFWGPNGMNGAIVAVAQTHYPNAVVEEVGIVLYRTSDGGTTWRAMPPYEIGEEYLEEAAAASEHGAMVFLREAVPELGKAKTCKVMRAGESGEWREVGSLACPSDGDTVQLPTPTDAFVEVNVPYGASPTVLMVTHDGGKTWKRARAQD